MSKSWEIRPVDPGSDHASILIQALDREILSHYPDLPVNGIDLEAFKAAAGFFVIAFRNDLALGCGAFRPLDPATAEIKRMFVIPSERRGGISRAILGFLEETAQARGFLRVRLETGIKQSEALALYRSAGYAEIPPFGQYVNSPISVCFEKILAG